MAIEKTMTVRAVFLERSEVAGSAPLFFLMKVLARGLQSG